jgi:hypothetical protein
VPRLSLLVGSDNSTDKHSNQRTSDRSTGGLGTSAQIVVRAAQTLTLLLGIAGEADQSPTSCTNDKTEQDAAFGSVPNAAANLQNVVITQGEGRCRSAPKRQSHRITGESNQDSSCELRCSSLVNYAGTNAGSECCLR